MEHCNTCLTAGEELAAGALQFAEFCPDCVELWEHVQTHYWCNVDRLLHSLQNPSSFKYLMINITVTYLKRCQASRATWLETLLWYYILLFAEAVVI